jgi:hypothetical protein
LLHDGKAPSQLTVKASSECDCKVYEMVYNRIRS